MQYHYRMATSDEVREKVEAEVSAFERFFCTELKNDVLSRPERAILHTYLVWKYRTEEEGEHAEASST